jgi:hypothetical protein
VVLGEIAAIEHKASFKFEEVKSYEILSLDPLLRHAVDLHGIDQQRCFRGQETR